MKVICKFNDIDDISDPDIQNKLKDQKINGINLKKNNEYNVYGIKLFEGNLYYLIFWDENHCFPEAYLSDFFEIIDNRMSKYFRIYYNKENLEINFNEWIEDNSFFEKLLDDYPDEIKKYREYKKLIDSEFPNLRMQLTSISNNISYFSNQFGILAGIVNKSKLEINKWYDIDVKFINKLEFRLNFLINDDLELKSNIEYNRLIMNLKIHDIKEIFENNDYFEELVCHFDCYKIIIPIIPTSEIIKIGDYINIKLNYNEILLNVI